MSLDTLPMSTFSPHLLPRHKFNYGNRPSRLHALTLADSDEDEPEQRSGERLVTDLGDGTAGAVPFESQSQPLPTPQSHSGIVAPVKRARPGRPPSASKSNSQPASTTFSGNRSASASKVSPCAIISEPKPRVKASNPSPRRVSNRLSAKSSSASQEQHSKTAITQSREQQLTRPRSAHGGSQTGSAKASKKEDVNHKLLEASSSQQNKKRQVKKLRHLSKDAPDSAISFSKPTRPAKAIRIKTRVPPHDADSSEQSVTHTGTALSGAHKKGKDKEVQNVTWPRHRPAKPKQVTRSLSPVNSDPMGTLNCAADPNADQALLAPAPKKARLGRMAGRSRSQGGIPSPPMSPERFRATSPAMRIPKRANARPMAFTTASNLFKSPPRHLSLAEASAQPLTNELSMDLPPVPAAFDTISSASLATMLGGGGGPKKTYGAARTFKSDENEMRLLLPMSGGSVSTPASRRSTTAGSMRLLSSSKKFKPRETYSALRKKWGVDEDDELIVGQPDLQTIAHQRASGSSKRFVDGLSYLLEGLSDDDDPKDLALKQSSAVELVRKFKGETFLEELKSNGMIESLYNALRAAGAGDGDPILDHALLVFISVMCCADQRYIEPVLRITPRDSSEVFSIQSDCLQILGKIARHCASKAEPCKPVPRFPRRQNQLVSQIEDVIRASELGKHVPSSSGPGLLALFSLARIAIFAPRPGLMPQRAVVHSGAFASVIKCLTIQSQVLKDRIEGYSQGLSLSPHNGEEVLKHISYCMDVIETCTLCEEDALKSIDLFRESLSTVFASLISLCHVLARRKEPGTASIGLDILIGCLRTMVNVTNFNTSWSDHLSTPAVLQALCGLLNLCRTGHGQSCTVSQSDDQKSASAGSEPPTDLAPEPQEVPDGVGDVVFDMLCVSLGLLANLVEQSSKARDLLRSIRIHEVDLPTDPRRFESYVCANPTPAFEEIINLYIDPPCVKSDEAEFIRGSVSILINLTLVDAQPRDEDGSQNEAEIVSGWKKVLDRDDGEADDARGRKALREFFKDLREWAAVDGSRAGLHGQLVGGDEEGRGESDGGGGGAKRLEECWKRLEVNLI